MCNFICGIVTTVIGAVLVIVCSVVGFAVVPGIITNIIENEVILMDDTVQLERFKEVPFALNFTVRLWNISNAAEVLNGGVAEMTEMGPYVYKLYQSRVVEDMGDDNITYRIVERFEFDAEGSFPNTEDDIVTIANVPYNAILQVAETLFPDLMSILSLGLNGIFGQHNSPVLTVRVRDLLFNGVPICANPGLVGLVACTQVRNIGAESQNLEVQEDGSLLFSLLAYKDGIESSQYVVSRGLNDVADLGRISLFNYLPHLTYWQDTENVEVSRCNMLNGTDSGLFAPFIDTDYSIYALNTDICRSVELRYQQDVDYEGIPAVRYSANEWFLDNDEGCFCIQQTPGVTGDDGCLLRGVMELYSCVDVFTLSHAVFLNALMEHMTFPKTDILYKKERGPAPMKTCLCAEDRDCKLNYALPVYLDMPNTIE